jgi:hypothetical protein
VMLQHRARLCRIELRPWPFGPPLRGRAPFDAAQPECTRQATAPVGGLAF